MNDGYTTPEGFWLSRALLLPDVREFGEVLEYLGEWNDKERPEPRYIPETPPKATAWERRAWRNDGRNEIGPFCTIEGLEPGRRGPSAPEAGLSRYRRSIAVRATDLTISAVENQLATPDDNLSFKLIPHQERNRMLVILSHGYIIGSHWLAYIDPNTVPAYPFERRDERFKQICEGLRENEMEPFVQRDGFTITVRAITGRTSGYQNIFHPTLRAVIHPDGHLTRTWADGTVTEEPA